MNEQSINNLKHIEKILRNELDIILKDSNKDIAYHNFYVNICKLIQLTQQNINIANDPIRHIKSMKRSNPDE